MHCSLCCSGGGGDSGDWTQYVVLLPLMYMYLPRAFRLLQLYPKLMGLEVVISNFMHCNVQGCHGHLWAACPVPDCEVARTYTPFCITMQSVYIHHI